MEDQPLQPSLLAMRLDWDVFLSFRGEHTRHTFTSPLRDALRGKGIRTFMDDVGLRSGDEIAPKPIEAIHDSAAAVAIISENYADSRWCLEELARLFESRKLVIPVFYRVNPSHVRRQTGSFRDAFRVLTRDYGDESVKRWRWALEMAGNRSGYVLDTNSDESQEMKMIVARVLTELSRIPVHVAAYPVGLDSHVAEVISSLKLQSNGVRFLGVYGQPGIGKTTLAKAVFSKLVACFKRRCFIADFKETLEKEGAVAIQNKLIYDLSLHTMRPVDDENAGKSAIRRLFSTESQPEQSDVDSRVLVVLDDVVDADHLKALGIQRKWLTEGSRIIATSRDKDTLLSFAYEDELYEAKELLDSEALELFSYHALRRKEPTEEFRSLCEEIVSFTGRLPLALEVFGSVLLDKRTTKEWEVTLKKLKEIRPSRLQDVLKLSYDELDEDHKIIFLDISCLFIQVGMKRVDAIDVFYGCGFNAEEAIAKLMQKSLLKITQDDILWMHDQLRDMGRQIVMQQDRVNPGNRSRLWNYDVVVNVLTNNMGTANVRGIILDTRRKKPLVDWSYGTSSRLSDSRNIIFGSKDLDLNMKMFEPLAKLKLLQINDVKFRSDINYLPAELRWLKWKGCLWETLPSTLPQEIRVLDLSGSCIQRLWGSEYPFLSTTQVIRHLMVLNLSDCYHLTSIPDLSDHRNLRKLVLEGCVKLSEIHESLGNMTSLIHLNLRRCSSLIKLPSDVSGLKNLEELILSRCSALTTLPCDIRSLKSLRELHLEETAVAELPCLFHLSQLELLMLDRCVRLKHLPKSIGNLSSLKILSLTGSGVEELPDSIGFLEGLEQLHLEHCTSLTNINDRVGSIKSLSKLHLTSSAITHLPDSCWSLLYLTSLSVVNCSLHTLPASIRGLSAVVDLHLNGTLIQELPDEIGSLKVIKNLQMGNCTLLRSLPESIGELFFLSTLNLEDTSITELPKSIGKLENLVTLRLNKCRSLRSLPRSFGLLKSLYHLWMEETAIAKLPENIGMLSKLVTLKMKKKRHQGLPEQSLPAEFDASSWNISGRIPGIGMLSKLMTLTMKKKRHQGLPEQNELPMSFGNLSLLAEFDASSWSISGQIPENFNMLSSMETLDLGYNSFCSLPSSLQGLSVLKTLVLSHCQQLELLPPLPSSLMELNATNCSALSCIPDLSNVTRLEELQLTNCDKLQDVPGLEHLRSLRRVYLAGCNASASAVRRRLSKATYEKLSYLGLPGSQIPDWFSKGEVVFSSRVNSALKSVIVGVVLSVNTGLLDDALACSPLSAVQARIWRAGKTNPTFTTMLSLTAMPRTCEDQLYLCRFKEFHPLVSLLEDGDKVEVSMAWPQLYATCIVLKRCGAFLVYDNDDAYEGNEELLEDKHQSVSKKLATFFSSLDGSQ